MMPALDLPYRSALVSGATGFIGSHLVRALLHQGCHVTVVGRTRNVAEAVDVIVDDGSVDDLAGAISDARPDVCFHLATHFVASHRADDIEPMIDANLRFGLRLCDALSTVDDVVLVNVGTVWQHHAGQQYSPVSLYAAMKQAFQDLVQYYAEVASMKTVTLELVDSYGPGDRRKKLVALLLEAAVSGATLEMSAGEQMFDVLHVDDIVAGLLQAPSFASTAAPIFALRSDAPPTVREFVERFETITGSRLSIEWGARPYRAREMMAPWTTTELLPGWSPAIDLAQGLGTLRREP